MATTARGTPESARDHMPELLPVIGSYRLAKSHRDTVYVAGHVSLKLDRSRLITGKVGNEISTQQSRVSPPPARRTYRSGRTSPPKPPRR